MAKFTESLPDNRQINQSYFVIILPWNIMLNATKCHRSQMLPVKGCDFVDILPDVFKYYQSY